MRKNLNAILNIFLISISIGVFADVTDQLTEMSEYERTFLEKLDLLNERTTACHTQDQLNANPEYREAEYEVHKEVRQIRYQLGDSLYKDLIVRGLAKARKKQLIRDAMRVGLDFTKPVMEGGKTPLQVAIEDYLHLDCEADRRKSFVLYFNYLEDITDITKEDKNYQDIIRTVAKAGDVELMEALAKKGADFSTLIDEDGNSFLLRYFNNQPFYKSGFKSHARMLFNFLLSQLKDVNSLPDADALLSGSMERYRNAGLELRSDYFDKGGDFNRPLLNGMSGIEHTLQLWKTHTNNAQFDVNTETRRRIFDYLEQIKRTKKVEYLHGAEGLIDFANSKTGDGFWHKLKNLQIPNLVNAIRAAEGLPPLPEDQVLTGESHSAADTAARKESRKDADVKDSVTTEVSSSVSRDEFLQMVQAASSNASMPEAKSAEVIQILDNSGFSYSTVLEDIGLPLCDAKVTEVNLPLVTMLADKQLAEQGLAQSIKAETERLMSCITHNTNSQESHYYPLAAAYLLDKHKKNLTALSENSLRQTRQRLMTYFEANITRVFDSSLVKFLPEIDAVAGTPADDEKPLDYQQSLFSEAPMAKELAQYMMGYLSANEKMIQVMNALLNKHYAFLDAWTMAKDFQHQVKEIAPIFSTVLTTLAQEQSEENSSLVNQLLSKTCSLASENESPLMFGARQHCLSHNH